MSHFIGLVFVDPLENDLETMLAPYDEQTEDPAFLEFVDKTDEVKKEFEKMPKSCPKEGKYLETEETTDEIKKVWNDAPDALDEEQKNDWWKPYSKEEFPTPTDIAKDKGYAVMGRGDDARFFRVVEHDYQYLATKEKYPTMTALAEQYFGYKKKGNKFGYIHNPNAKWDWYADGGRWNGYLINKEGNNTDEDLLTEIDWDKMFQPDADGYDHIPFCFVDTNGEWHEKGEMGWWGMTSNEMKKADWHEQFKSYVQSLLAEAYDEEGKPYEDGIQVYAIDFHI